VSGFLVTRLLMKEKIIEWDGVRYGGYVSLLSNLIGKHIKYVRPVGEAPGIVGYIDAAKEIMKALDLHD
jgi:hypothetical protein